MRNKVILLFLVGFLAACGTSKELGTSDHVNDVLRLEELNGRYIDLSHWPVDTLYITGTHKGDRLVFRNAENIVLNFDAKVLTQAKEMNDSVRIEDAIAFLGPVTNFSITGKLKVNNAITFWGKLDRVEITGLVSRGAHTGIRFTQAFPHRFVDIHDNLISKTSFEGIYAGPSYETSDKLQQVRIYNNKVVQTGWDAIQIGNCLDCMIEGNTILKAATKDEPNQNWAITVNPGSRAYLRGNLMLGCKQRIQVLDSRAFIF